MSLGHRIERPRADGGQLGGHGVGHRGLQLTEWRKPEESLGSPRIKARLGQGLKARRCELGPVRKKWLMQPHVENPAIASGKGLTGLLA